MRLEGKSSEGVRRFSKIAWLPESCEVLAIGGFDSSTMAGQVLLVNVSTASAAARKSSQDGVTLLESAGEFVEENGLVAVSVDRQVSECIRVARTKKKKIKKKIKIRAKISFFFSNAVATRRSARLHFLTTALCWPPQRRMGVSGCMR
jgi:hypothetical protein